MSLKKPAFVLLFLIAAATTLITYATFIEPQRLTIEKIEISSPKLSPGNDITIVQLSDVHLTSIGNLEQKVVQQVNDLQPDLIVVTGDMFSRSPVFEKEHSKEFDLELEHIVSFLASLHAKHGLYLIRGNNDFGNDKETSNRYLEKMEQLGVPLLANAKRLVTINNTKLNLVGVDYPEQERERVAEFWVSDSAGNRYLQSDYSRSNTYSHFFAVDDPSRWRNYIYSGRMRLTDPAEGSIGVTFYSQFHRGYDKFYRCRETAKEANFRFSPHGTDITGGKRDTQVVLRDDRWHWFKIAVQSDSVKTEMRAKLWPEGWPEPADWQAQAFDDSTTHLTGGTVGVWSSGGGYHQLDDLTVVTESGDTLLHTDFEDDVIGENAGDWVSFNHDHDAIPILMRGVPDSIFTVLLAHTPDFVKWEKMTGIDLVLSGHTHGGQIRLPLFGPPIVRIKLGRKYMQGLHRIDNTWLYVNRGIGTILLPMRLFCPPEITLIKLKAERGACIEKND